MTYYILLMLSILLEVIGVFCLNAAEGFTNFVPTILAILFYCSSIAIYILLTAHREVGTVNAVFAGTGTVLVTLIGIIFFNETISTLKLIGISLIITGAVSINLRFESNRNMCKES
ncbi:DMT family transporter [Bacillus pumilus]|uniref:DMT family transporter n=1 Tax=Bacillus pumilus TaxID=1408 RepID=UPI00145C1EF3|nr:SMR family transporter [Bacillus pumilus]